jgi:hypothetical protein
MYEQKYNRYKFKYLCLQLQKAGYNPLKTNSMVMKEMSDKLCKDLKTEEKEACEKQFQTEVDPKLEKNYAVSINFMAAAMAVIDCPEVGKERTDAEQDCSGGVGMKEAKIEKCKQTKTLQYVASMFLAILFNISDVELGINTDIRINKDGTLLKLAQSTTDYEPKNAFMSNIVSMIDSKVRNCPEEKRDEKRKHITEYFIRVIDKINANLADLPRFLKEPSGENKDDQQYGINGMNKLLHNPEYAVTTEEQNNDGIYYISNCNSFFKMYLKKLNYIQNYKINGIHSTAVLNVLPSIQIPISGTTNPVKVIETNGPKCVVKKHAQKACYDGITTEFKEEEKRCDETRKVAVNKLDKTDLSKFQIERNNLDLISKKCIEAVKKNTDLNRENKCKKVDEELKKCYREGGVNFIFDEKNILKETISLKKI